MPPGGMKRVRATRQGDSVPGVATRSGKKYSTTFPESENTDTDPMKQVEEQDPVLDWSVFYEQTNADEHAVSEQTNADVSEQLETVPEGK